MRLFKLQVFGHFDYLILF